MRRRLLVEAAFVLVLLGLFSLLTLASRLPSCQRSEVPLSGRCEAPVELALPNGAEALWCDRDLDGLVVLLDRFGLAGCTRSVVAVAKVSGGPLRLILAGDCRVLSVRAFLSGRTAALLGLPIDVNRAGREDLEAVSGVGPALAAAIIAERAAGGPFCSPAELERVRGIGPKKAAAFAPHLEFKCPNRKSSK